MQLNLYSERYQPQGNIDAKAARRAIGLPTMDPWAVFLRETVQNSWDARLSQSGSIVFAVEGLWLSEDQRKILGSEVFNTLPVERAELLECLKDEDLSVLIVRDENTKGLQGPTRADVASKERDFVDFVRNIGRAEDKALGGGTYGFGKGVLYDASACATVLVFSRTTEYGVPVSRFIAISNGSTFELGSVRYTGRHWWGVADRETGVEPVTGESAERLAESLGLAISPGKTGTAIAVIAPVAHHHGDTLEMIVQKIANAATFWAWPHMVPIAAGPSIHFNFAYDGGEVFGPDPSTHPSLQSHVEAYVRAIELDPVQGESSWPWVTKEIRAERPVARLGTLAYRRSARPAQPAPSVVGEPELGHHIALMRTPRFIVKYLAVRPDPQGRSIAGVFVADDGLDEEFARAEPVAHDDWVHERLLTQKFKRNQVKIALDKLNSEFKSDPTSSLDPSMGGQAIGVTRLATAMGDLLSGQPSGTDASIPASIGGKKSKGGSAPSGNSGTTPTGRRRRNTANLLPDVGVVLFRDQMLARFEIQANVGVDAGLRLTANSKVVLDGGGAEQPGDGPVGAEVPEVIGWLIAPNDQYIPGIQLNLFTPGDVRVGLLIKQPADAAVSVSLSSEEVSFEITN